MAMEAKSVSTRISLLAALPLGLAIIFMTLSGAAKLGVYGEMSRLVAMVGLAEHVSALVHDTQRERGAPGGFSGSKGLKFGSELSEQRRQTDVRRQALSEYLATFDATAYGDEFSATLTTALQKMEEIDGYRSKVTAQSISTSQALGLYTAHNTAMLHMVQDTSRVSSNAEMTRLSLAYVSFLQAKERAGIERALGSKVFANQRFDKGELRRFTSLVAAQRTYFGAFRAQAAPEQTAFYDQTMSGPAIDETKRLRDILFDRGTESTKALLVAELQRNLGYGGAIHQFKNFVLGMARKQQKRFQQTHGQINERLDEWVALSAAAEEERAHVQTVR
ncbi:MAG: hypothetical protein GY946_26585, partial [bacterium]|nr:hypothetical protein [bacterium]